MEFLRKRRSETSVPEVSKPEAPKVETQVVEEEPMNVENEVIFTENRNSNTRITSFCIRMDCHKSAYIVDESATRKTCI